MTITESCGESRVAPRPGVMEIAPYQVGGSHLDGAAKIIKLSANENPWGPSPRAIEAMRAAGERLALYPDADSSDLRSAIAEIHGLDRARIVCGNGSDELLQLLAFAYARDGDEVLHSRHGFLLYPSYALMNGATPVAAPETNLTSDVDALLAACTERTRLVYLANPNNPTGTRLNSQEVERLAAGIPEHALLILDAAYAEYVDADDYDGGASLVERRPNVVMSRTFSKIYGLAALRVGWIYASADVVAVINRVRGPYNLNAAAQAAAAAAMRDVEYTARIRAETLRLRARLVADLAASGVSTTPSHGNFVLAAFGEGETGAAAADAFLKSRGIIARRVDAYGLAGHLRITIGDEAACDAVAAAIREFRGLT
ncbi:MAG: histidinol-phosphate transaminase [Paracoccaceae bacterium]